LGTFLAIESTEYDNQDKVTKNEQKVKQDNCFKKKLVSTDWIYFEYLFYETHASKHELNAI